MNEKMLEIDAYNALASFCKRVEPYPANLIQLGRKFIREVECRGDINGKTKKELELVIMSDMFVVVQVGRTMNESNVECERIVRNTRSTNSSFCSYV